MSRIWAGIDSGKGDHHGLALDADGKTLELPATPDAVQGDPLQMHWQHNALLEDVQLTGVLRGLPPI